MQARMDIGVWHEYVDPDGHHDALRRMCNLVRCKDCKRYDKDAGFCTRFKEVVEEHLDLDWPHQQTEWGYLESAPDGFCKWGERKEQ